MCCCGTIISAHSKRKGREHVLAVPVITDDRLLSTISTGDWPIWKIFAAPQRWRCFNLPYSPTIMALHSPPQPIADNNFFFSSHAGYLMVLHAVARCGGHRRLERSAKVIVKTRSFPCPSHPHRLSHAGAVGYQHLFPRAPILSLPC